MANRQTRRTVSINKHVFDVLTQLATRAGMGRSEYVTNILREYLPDLPNTKHEKPPAHCDCGEPKPRAAESCNRCAYLDGTDTALPLDRIIGVLRTNNGMSMRELCEALGLDVSHSNGQRSMFRWIKTLTEQGRIRRYWRENTMTEERRVFKSGGKARCHVGCWVYALDGLTDEQWRRKAS